MSYSLKTAKRIFSFSILENDLFLQKLIQKSSIERNLAAEEISKQLKNLTYISADRIPPAELYEVGSSDAEIVVGSKGQYTICVLEIFKELKVNQTLLYHASNFNTLFRQVESWLGHFFPGTILNINPIKNVSKLSLGIKTSKETEFLRPQNVGYGITQLLPIITACLKAKSGDIILIENPEAHLHPYGQSEIGAFLANVASTGVQIIVESHSENVLNGIRKGMLSNKNLNSEDIMIYFFEDIYKKDNRIIPIHIEPNGDLSDFPVDFFDQARQDLREILKRSRR